jgi:hypothetical protein
MYKLYYTFSIESDFAGRRNFCTGQSVIEKQNTALCLTERMKWIL